MANCSVCNGVLVGFTDNDTITHFACYGKTPVGIVADSTGPAWVADPSSSGKIAYQLLGSLSSQTMSDGDNRFLWAAASIDKPTGSQVCGTKGTYYHNSDGASRMDKKDRNFTSVFYLIPEKNKIAIHGIGNHCGGKGATAEYRVDWQDGSTTTFELGKKVDKAQPN